MIGWANDPIGVTQVDPPWEVDQANPPWEVDQANPPWLVDQANPPWIVDQANTWEVEQTRDLNVDLPNFPAGWWRQVVFGQRFNIPTATTADIWTGTALTRPLPLAPKAMSIVSTSASDNSATVLGAKTVVVTFIDSAGDWRMSDLLNLNGLTAVPITYKPGQILVTQGAVPTPPDGSSVAASIFRIQGVAVVTDAGSTEAAPRVANVGTLRVLDTATLTTSFENVPIGLGLSQAAAFHVPRNFEARLTRLNFGTARGQGRIELATTFGLGTAFLRSPLTPLNDSSLSIVNDSATVPGAPRSDFQAVIITGSNSIDVSGIFQIRLKPI